MAAKKPDFIIGVLDPETGHRAAAVGAIWTNDDGTLRIVINPGCVLDYQPTLVIKGFPDGYKPKPEKPKQRLRKPAEAEYDSDDGDDVPF